MAKGFRYRKPHGRPSTFDSTASELPDNDHSMMVVVAIVVIVVVMVMVITIIRLCINRDRRDGDDSQKH